MARARLIHLLILIGGLATTGALAAQPARLESLDPLTQAPPASLRTFVLPRDTQRPEEKIVPRLWARLAGSADDEAIPVIVELREPSHRMTAAAAAADLDSERAELTAAAEHRFAAASAGLVSGLRGLSHFPIVFGTAVKADVPRLAALPEVLRIYEDEVVQAMRVQGAALIKADTLRTVHGGSGNGIGVAVLDTGIEGTHPELASKIVAQGDFTGTTGNGTVDDNGHGTSAAGIIAGAMDGMAPQATLWAIKVLNAQGQGSTSAILSGLNSIFASRAQFGGLDLVNMSLGVQGPFNGDCDASVPYNSVLNALTSAGIAIFVASGNNGDGNGISSPACHSKVIAVGAVFDANLGGLGFPDVPCTDATTAADKITCYSDSGLPLDILAPSHCARTPTKGGGLDNCFGGTSAAAPYAAGVAAQLLSLHPGTSPAALQSALMTTGKPLTGANGVTRGRIDAVAALQALGGGGTGACVRDADTACLVGNRFEVEVDWQTAAASGAAQVMTFTGQRAENDDSAFFWFFSPTNFEMGLKILNACAPPFNSFWVFISGLTDQGWTVHIRDTQTGATKTYANAVGVLTPTTADTAALACP